MSPDEKAARALVTVLGDVEWETVALAYGYLASLAGSSLNDAARAAYDHGYGTLRKSSERLQAARKEGFLAQLPLREKVGSAENPITKLFPAAITEQRFLEMLEDLQARRPGLDYMDDRETGHTLSDFTLHEGELTLPINIKNAGTRFNQAASLVQIDPDDCIPIPAYKAYGALERLPSLLYVVAVDYNLIGVLDKLLPRLLDEREAIVWSLLNKFAGARLRKAEDVFVQRVIRRHWERVRAAIAHPDFRGISARKAVRVLQTMPHRTPGIGLRAWGTSARGEVNVHLCISSDTKPWQEIETRIIAGGLANIVEAINRRRHEWVYDPEI